MIGRIFGIALIFLLIASTLAFAGLTSQNQALAWDGKTWHVDDDLQDYPDADFAKIQDAVNAAGARDTIIVYPGTYTENVNVNKSLTIQPENGSANCTIEAQNPNDHVFEISANDVTIEGFTVTGATGGDCAGIYASHASNLNIIGNNTPSNYNGIYLENVGTAAV